MWLPPAFRSARFGTHALPPARHFEGEEEFDAGNAATPLDQIVTDRLTADDYPVVSLGQWTNFAELATGLGWATADQPSYNRASGRTGDSLPIDNVERAVLLRRAFEEYKAAACCADEVLAPNSVRLTDYTQGLTPVLWALQVVNALPYPLLARTEWFALNDHENPDDIKVASFLRNEGLVTISSQVKKIILLVSAPQKRIRIGGAEVPASSSSKFPEIALIRDPSGENIARFAL
ncbi:hypothetical protein ACJJTC_016582 [Scirpophaga incertulas]